MSKWSTVGFLCITLLILTTSNARAQSEEKDNPKENSIHLQIGPVHTRLIDEGYTESKLLFRGTASKIGLGYTRTTNKYILNFGVAISAGSVQSKSGSLPSDFIFLQPTIEYLQKIKTYQRTARTSELFLGLQVSSMNYILQNEPRIDNIDIFSLHGAWLTVTNRIRLTSKQNLDVSLSLPAMIYTNHVLWNGGASNYTYSDKDHPLRLITNYGKWSYFNPLSGSQFRVAYQLKIAKNISVGITYKFIYSGSRVKQPIHIYSNEVLFGLICHF